jgi:hypothetical protein
MRARPLRSRTVVRAKRVGKTIVPVHADGVEGADLDADLAAHADGYVDVEDSGVKLRFADEIGLLIGAFFDVNASRRTFFFTNLAADAAQACIGVSAVVEQEGILARGLGQLAALLGILNCSEAVFIDEAAEEVSGCLRESLEDAFTEHVCHPSSLTVYLSHDYIHAA